MHKKLLSKKFAKHALIVAGVMFAVSILGSLVVLYMLYDMAGTDLNGNSSRLEVLGNIAHICVWVSKLSVAIMIVAGISLAWPTKD